MAATVLLPLTQHLIPHPFAPDVSPRLFRVRVSWVEIQDTETTGESQAWVGASARLPRSPEFLVSISETSVRSLPSEHARARLLLSENVRPWLAQGKGTAPGGPGWPRKRRLPVPGVRYAGEFPDSGNSGPFRREGTHRRVFQGRERTRLTDLLSKIPADRGTPVVAPPEA